MASGRVNRFSMLKVAMRKLMPPSWINHLPDCPGRFGQSPKRWYLRAPPWTDDDPRLARGCILDCEQPYILTAANQAAPARAGRFMFYLPKPSRERVIFARALYRGQ